MTAVPVGSLHSDWDGGLLGRGGVGLGEVESSFDRDREAGEVEVADHLAELLSASSIPAAVHRSPISPEDQCLTLRCVVRTQSIIDSHGLVDSSVRRSLP